MPAEVLKRSNEPNRRIIQCLRCEKGMDNLPTHLARVCMKTNTDEERENEMKKAKASNKKWNLEGRTWDYREICKLITDEASRLALVKYLKSKGFFVKQGYCEDTVPPTLQTSSLHEIPTTSAPGEIITAIAVPSTSVAAAALPGIRSESDTDVSSSCPGEAADSDDDTLQNDPTLKTAKRRQTILRDSMGDSGLYDRFGPEVKRIKGFTTYLRDTLKVTNFQQEVDNVARMLRYLQPEGEEVDLDFLIKHNETTAYVDSLFKAGLQATTVNNYLKSMSRFLKHIERNIEVFLLNTEKAKDIYIFHSKVGLYGTLIKDLQKPVYKRMARQLCQKRQELLEAGVPRVLDLQKVICESHGDMQKLFKKLENGDRLKEVEMTTYRRICQAILLIKHMQRPSVVEGFTVTEWERGLAGGKTSGRWVFTCVDHKTGTKQLAPFVLTDPDKLLFQEYLKCVRPRLVNQLTSNGGKFFLCSNGGPVKATNDLDRLHLSYNCKKVNSQLMRTSFETEANGCLTDAQKAGVVHYLSHTEDTAKNHYRLKERKQLIEISKIISRFTGDVYGLEDDEQDDEEDDEANTITSKPMKVREQAKEQKGYDDLVKEFPVTLDGGPPPKKMRIEAGFNDNEATKKCYDQWRFVQRCLRQKQILRQLTRRRPTVECVNKYIQKENWKTNLPQAKIIVEMWTPANRPDAEKDPNIIGMVKSQDWPGVVIIPGTGEKGEGVAASTTFSKGDILCDYHGSDRSSQEGKKKLAETVQGDMGYVFFFNSVDGKQRCIDATADACQCHPDMNTFGRKINHSKSRNNVKPVACQMILDEKTDEVTNVILFKAIRDINAHDEILFDYGVNRKSNNGEGMDLEWLDE